MCIGTAIYSPMNYKIAIGTYNYSSIIYKIIIYYLYKNKKRIIVKFNLCIYYDKHTTFKYCYKTNYVYLNTNTV